MLRKMYTIGDGLEDLDFKFAYTAASDEGRMVDESRHQRAVPRKNEQQNNCHYFDDCKTVSSIKAELTRMQTNFMVSFPHEKLRFFCFPPEQEAPNNVRLQKDGKLVCM